MASERDELSDKERLEQGWIHCSAIIEVLGKPKEHVEQTLKDYVKQIKESKDIKVIKEDFAPAEPQQKTLYSAFVELEMWVNGVANLVWFCFDYMPSSVEVIEPETIKYKSHDFSGFLNDLQARLHGLDMIIKKVTTESQILQKNTKQLLRNIVMIALKDRDRNLEDLAGYIGLEPKKLEPFLKEMEKDKIIVNKKGLYSKK